MANGEIGNLNLYALLRARHSRDLRVVLWTFGFDPSRGFDPVRRPRDRIRRWLYEHADAVIFYWDEGRREVENFLGPRPSFYVAPNTLETDRLLGLRERLDCRGVTAVREEIGVRARCHFVCVARLVADKEVDRLLRAWGRFPALEHDAWLTVVGSGPERPVLEALARELQLERVSFAGALTDPETVARYLFASDAMILPGRLGLAVVHAFCFGAPVISQRKSSWFHGEGIGYLEHEVNGLLVPDDRPDLLARAMIRVATDPRLRERLSRGAERTARTSASIEGMLRGFEEALEATGSS